MTDMIPGLGTRSDYVTRAPDLNVIDLKLSPEEMMVFVLVGKSTEIGEILDRCGLGEEAAKQALLSLKSKSIIQRGKPPPPKPAAPPPAPAPTAAAPRAPAADAVDLEPERQKEIADLDKTLEKANHFEALGLLPTSTPEEAKKAFYEASKRYHPDRFFGKNLGPFKARVDRIFKRLSEAHQVLSDPERRAAYLKENPHLAPAPPPPRVRTKEDDQRDAERRARLAKHPYLAKAGKLNEHLTRAREHMAKNEFGHAHTQLHMASQIDPRNAEVKELLAQARKKNDQARFEFELKKGAEAERIGDLPVAVAAYKAASVINTGDAGTAYKAAKLLKRLNQDLAEVRLFAQRAVDAEPNNADYRSFLGVVFLEAGMKALAKRQFEEALRIDPKHAEARKHGKNWWSF